MPRIERPNLPETLVTKYDCLLLDLDGTVYRGSQPTAGAVQSLTAASAVRQLYVTNNASRSAAEVAAHLVELGLSAAEEDVVTSAQSAARLLAEQLSADAAVLVVGTDQLAAEVSAVGLRPVRTFDAGPSGVIQGHSPKTTWADLAEAALAIRAGAYWVAANADATLPTERGLLPGNGSLVAALRTATDCDPVVAGKPGRALIDDALARGTFAHPLMIGDRLDTDIAGANATNLPSLMVLTGVSTALDAVWAPADVRPTYLGLDLSALHEPLTHLLVSAHSDWQIIIDDESVSVRTAAESADALSLAQALAAAVWETGPNPAKRSVVGVDDHAEQILRVLSGPAIN